MAPPISAALPAVSARLSSASRRAGCREQRHQCQQRHDRHVLEQQDRERALAIDLLQMAALLQDAERDRGGGEREREAATSAPRQSNSPVSSASAQIAAAVSSELRDAEAENVAPHREQAR